MLNDAVANISVIVPTFNRASFLPNCVQSILTSGLESLEVVVVDDGSTDDTEIVATTLPDAVRYFRQKNKGPAAARNFGIAQSCGRYIAFLDSDDTWMPGQHQKLLAALEANADVDLVFGDALFGTNENGFESFIKRFAGTDFCESFQVMRPGGIAVLDRRDLLSRLLKRCMMFLGSLIIRRSALDKLGGFDESIWGQEDWALFMMAAVTLKVAFKTQCTASKYLKHGGDTVTSHDEDIRGARVRALESFLTASCLTGAEREPVVTFLRECRLGWAWMAYDRGDLQLTKSRLKEAVSRASLSPRERLMYVMTLLPRPVYRMIRILWQCRKIVLPRRWPSVSS